MKKIGGMATVKVREESLYETLDSLYKQLDLIHVYLNDYETISERMQQKASEYKNVNFHLAKDHAGDLGDAAKFYFIGRHKDALFYSLDDDLIYPANYASEHQRYLRHFNYNIATSFHGTMFYEFPLRGFYNPKNWCAGFHYLSNVQHFQFVQFGGTGVMCQVASKTGFSFDKLGEERNMADVWHGIHCQKTYTPIAVIPHADKYILHTSRIDAWSTGTIWGRNKEADKPSEVINKELTTLILHTAIRNK
jgi:hypothetical protein